MEKLLRAYIRHVIESDGSSFLNEGNTRHSEGLDNLEPEELAQLNEIEREVVKQMWTIASPPISGPKLGDIVVIHHEKGRVEVRQITK